LGQQHPTTIDTGPQGRVLDPGRVYAGPSAWR